MKRIIVFAIMVFCAAAVNASAEEAALLQRASGVMKNKEAKADVKRSAIGARALKSSASRIKTNAVGKIDKARAAVQSSKARMQAQRKRIKARAGTSISSAVPKRIKVPKISTAPRIKPGRAPKFRQTSLQSHISSSGGTNERNIKSTSSAMSNMQVRYMNKVMNGQVDFAINQGGK
ncbi:MAG: hypothetical protein MJA29_12030 [Candidatus Omnitrophica bacterium]|nr:hypothetical protein [Candidatus Omnitrophota bacterium]